MRRKVLVAALVVALAAYAAAVGWRGVLLLGEDGLVPKVLGAAVLALPLLGVVLAGLELRFGLAVDRLARRLPEPPPDLPRRPSGRVDRAAADQLFAQRRDEVQADPDDWRGWFRLAEAYDLAGDRRRARAAMRTAIDRAQE